MPRIVVAGTVTVRLTHQRGRLDVQLGGTALTAATTARALGADVALATYVGTDALGLVAATGLRAKGWFTSATLVCGEQPRCLVLDDGEGLHHNISDMRSAWDLRYPQSKFDVLVGQGCDAVLLSSVGFTLPLIDLAVDRDLPIATDVHLIRDIDYARKQAWLRAATVLACSHERLPTGPAEWIEAVWRRYATPVVLVGCGPEGALLGERGTGAIWHVPATTPRGVRFTVGAGDTLLAAFMHRYLSGQGLVPAARSAVLAAGWKIGGSPDEEFNLSSAGLAQLAEAHGLPPARRLS